MKALLCLAVFGAALCLCHGACFQKKNEVKIKEGKLVLPDVCVDPFDKSEHPRGTAWNSHNCLRCTCSGETMSCCTRYGGAIMAPKGCEATLDKELCEYKIHKRNDPSEPCTPDQS